MNRALFLDRDGTLNVDTGYLHSPVNTVLKPGAIELVRAANELDALVFIVTNQAGIGRGYYSEKDFFDFDSWFRSFFARFNARIDATYYCPDAPESNEATSVVRCRKPSPWMLLRAAEDFDVDPFKSVMVGDAESDSDAASTAGVGHFFRIGNDVAAGHMPLRSVVPELVRVWGMSQPKTAVNSDA